MPTPFPQDAWTEFKIEIDDVEVPGEDGAFGDDENAGVVEMEGVNFWNGQIRSFTPPEINETATDIGDTNVDGVLAVPVGKLEDLSYTMVPRRYASASRFHGRRVTLNVLGAKRIDDAGITYARFTGRGVCKIVTSGEITEGNVPDLTLTFNPTVNGGYVSLHMGTSSLTSATIGADTAPATEDYYINPVERIRRIGGFDFLANIREALNMNPSSG